MTRDRPVPVYAYRSGLALLRHVSEPPSWMSWDDRADAWTAPGHRYGEVRRWAEARGISADPEAGVVDGPASESLVFDVRSPRPYQSEALDRWRAAGRRGTVVLPTGSGKTLVAMLALGECGATGCVVVPTRALLVQWHAQLSHAFDDERVGAFYGDEKDVRPITVTTYRSAFALLERHGGRFGLVVLDEAHHLGDTADGSATASLDALRIAPASRRLGLTATYPERDAGLREMVGPVVYRRALSEMADAELAGFATDRRFVRLLDSERERYDALTAVYETWMRERAYQERISEPAHRWKAFMAETRTSPRARRAHRAFLERDRIVALADRKLAEAERMLRLYPAEQAILFCGSTEAAERVSRRLAIPMISASTPASERRAVLAEIDAGRIRAVASVRVLDEGWDVPAAKLGLVLGDTSRGGQRQHAQRLGRLLRRQGDRVASLYEIVVADTQEFLASQKRGAGIRDRTAGQLGLGL